VTAADTTKEVHEVVKEVEKQTVAVAAKQRDDHPINNDWSAMDDNRNDDDDYVEQETPRRQEIIQEEEKEVEKEVVEEEEKEVVMETEKEVEIETEEEEEKEEVSAITRFVPPPHQLYFSCVYLFLFFAVPTPSCLPD
jgi:hypothetical protein